MMRVAAPTIAACMLLAFAAPARADEPPPPADPAPDAKPEPVPPTAPAPVPAAPAAVTAPNAGPFQLASLAQLRDRGVLTQAQFDEAVRELRDSIGANAEGATSLAVGRWTTTIYGFLEADHIFDSTQSFIDQAGNTQVERPAGYPPPPPLPQTTYRGENPRLQFGVRNTRFGLQIRTPEVHRVRASGTLEMDFLGFEPAPTYDNRTGTTEQGFFTSPALRARHAYFKLDTPILDVLVGQTWHPLMQPTYAPNSVEIQGLPGQIYARTPQVRLSKTVDTGVVTLQFDAAALRPPQRDAASPELAGGVRFAVDKWTGMHTSGATGTGLLPASFSIAADMRDFRAPNFEQIPTSTVHLTTMAFSAHAFLPVIPATKERKGNSLSLTGQFGWSDASADLYSMMTGGMAFPSLPNKTGINPPPVYPQNVDNGLVVFDIQNQDLHPIQWTSYVVGLEYYLPGLDGRVWLSGNYSHMQSENIDAYARPGNTPPNPQDYAYVAAAQVRQFEDFFDVNVFVDPLPSVRLGAEYAYFNDRYVDGTHAINHRAQLSGFFMF